DHHGYVPRLKGIVQGLGRDADDLKIILGSFPKDESLFWMAENGIETAADQSILLEYPPEFMIEDIRRFCEQIGVYLTLSQ
ncbi:MAG: hypothetical protein HGB14_06730, partial [Anaerolineaceae bacterium]|nr:hypothetical protein [Anaerolineaceae bacterium]